MADNPTVDRSGRTRDPEPGQGFDRSCDLRLCPILRGSHNFLYVIGIRTSYVRREIPHNIPICPIPKEMRRLGSSTNLRREPGQSSWARPSAANFSKTVRSLRAVGEIRAFCSDLDVAVGHAEDTAGRPRVADVSEALRVLVDAVGHFAQPRSRAAKLRAPVWFIPRSMPEPQPSMTVSQSSSESLVRRTVRTGSPPGPRIVCSGPWWSN